jgi:pimeloyl-ACP methyl ester carboxylesterase
MSQRNEWQLTRSLATSAGRVAYDVLGSGPPLVLVHGTPSSSYLWRHVARQLSHMFTVYLYDLLGYGASEQRHGQDVSVEAQGQLLARLLDHWNLREPRIAAHDIGGAIALRVLLLANRRYRRLALCDPVAIAPWITPFSRHVQRYLEAFQTVPEHIHRELVAAHMRTAIARKVTDDELDPYLRPWLGSTGQSAYYRQVAQFDEWHTREIEQRYAEIETPTLILWGSQDAWLDPRFGQQLAAQIPGARLKLIEDAGHFLQEDQPDAVTAALKTFFED